MDQLHVEVEINCLSKALLLLREQMRFVQLIRCNEVDTEPAIYVPKAFYYKLTREYR